MNETQTKIIEEQVQDFCRYMEETGGTKLNPFDVRYLKSSFETAFLKQAIEQKSEVLTANNN